MLQKKFIVHVTTLPDCDDITRFDGTSTKDYQKNENEDGCQVSGGQTSSFKVPLHLLNEVLQEELKQG
jgi:hypothetical protein